MMRIETGKWNGNSMQNPGDTTVPEGVIINPTRRVLIMTNGEAKLIDRTQFDDVVPLFGEGDPPTDEDEQEVLKETTFSR